MSQGSFFTRFFLWKRFSSFTYLNLTQLLVTLNDSIFRLLVAFSLIDKLGKDQSSTILFLSGVIFVAPFLVFSMPAGELADKCSKQKVIAWTLVAEILGMAYGIFAMHVGSVVNAYVALFVVALQASVFNPAKYAILPEIVKREDISKANGIMTLATYLAIIGGTFFASFITQVTDRNYTLVALICLIIAVLGFVFSLQIEKTEVKNPEKKINLLFLVEVYRSLKLASKYPHLLLAVLASSYFLFTASYTQLNIIPYGLQSLNITDVQAGYVFLAAALGIGIGSTIVAYTSSKHVELGISIWGAFGTSFSYIILFLFSKNIWIAVFMILSLGINGGLYIVPLDAYIQIASPEKDRGAIVASGSFLGFVGVLLAALSIGFFSDILHLTAAQGYFIIGLLSLAVSISILFLLPDYFTRFLALSLFRFFYHIEPKNQPPLDFYEPAVIITEHCGTQPIIALLQLYPRLLFLRLTKKRPSRWLKPFYFLLHILPYYIDSTIEEQKQFFEILGQKKMPLGLFLKVSPSKRRFEKAEEILTALLKQNPYPVIPAKIHSSHPQSSADSFFNLLKILPVKIEVDFKEKLSCQSEFSKIREKLQLT